LEKKKTDMLLSSVEGSFYNDSTARDNAVLNKQKTGVNDGEPVDVEVINEEAAKREQEEENAKIAQK